MTTTDYTGFATLAATVTDGVATVTFTGTGPGNAMGRAFFAELPELFAALAGDEAVRAVVLRGAGGHFSYGLDLADMAGMLDDMAPGASAADRRRFLDALRGLQAAFTAVAACPKPVVAAIDGWCIGGGVDLIAAADIRVATAAARFSIRETRMGMVADLGSLQRLGAIIGDGNLRELALTGRDFEADIARDIGLVTRLCADGDELVRIAGDVAREIAANSPLVTAGVKAVLDAERADRIEAGLRFVAAWNAAFFASEDLAEARAAFAAKRPPRFTGR